MPSNSTGTAIQTPTSGSQPLAISRWLLVVAALVFLMVVVGGITRLTESGLSITEWKPISGALPPLSEADWQSEFAKYKEIPEYIEINGPAGMTLSDFKTIYFWEWIHRLLGRVIGLAFALPLAWFWIRGQIPKGYKLRLLALLVLGGLQGVIGWWMVVSGLTARTDVSHFRLATHLLLALLILAGLVWVRLDLIRLNREGLRPARMTGFGLIVLAVLFVQLLFGAFTAGLNAGYISNTWPLMSGRFFPAGVDWAAGLLHAMLNNHFMIHFIHRWWAWVLVVAVVVLARRVRGTDRRASVAINSAVGIQVLLGIATVMSTMNITLAVLHQAVGAVLVIAVVWGVYVLGVVKNAGSAE